MKNRIICFIVLALLVVGLVLCVAMNKYFVVQKLIKSIRNNDYSSVEEIITNHPESINMLPSAAPNGWNSAMNQRNEYPLTEACLIGDVSIIELLVQNGANVNSNNGLTPLSITYRKKNENWYEVSVYLIQNGACLDYSTQYSGDYSSVLQDIVQVRPGVESAGYVSKDDEEVMAAFCYAIENCDHSKVNWMRVLQASITNDRMEIVKLLLDNNYCGVNDSSLGMTALMFAARDSTVNMVSYLLECGADAEAVSESGKTAMDYAVASGNKSVVEVLNEYLSPQNS